MKKYNLHFEIYNSIHSFWIPLMKHFFKNGNNLRVDCWNSERDAINRLLRYAKSIDIESNKAMTILLMDIKEEVLEDIFANPFDTEGKVFWFSMFIMNGEEIIFSSEHHGTEFYIENITENDIEFIRSIVPIDSDLHLWESNEGNELAF